MSQEDPGIAELVRLATNFAIAHGWRQTKIWKNPEHGDLPIFEANIHDTVREVTPVHLDLNHNLIVWQEFGKSEQFAIPFGPESSIPPAPPPAHNGPAPPAPAPTHDSHHGEPSSFVDPRLDGVMEKQNKSWENQYKFNREQREWNTRQEGYNTEFETKFTKIQEHEDAVYARDQQLEEDAMKNLKDFQEEKKLEQKEIQELRERVSQQEAEIRRFGAEQKEAAAQQNEINKLIKELEKTRAAREAQKPQQAASLPQRRGQSVPSRPSVPAQSSSSRSRGRSRYGHRGR